MWRDELNFVSSCRAKDAVVQLVGQPAFVYVCRCRVEPELAAGCKVAWGLCYKVHFKVLFGLTEAVTFCGDKKRQLYKVVGKVNFFRTLGHDVQSILAPVYAHTRHLTTWNDSAPLPPEVKTALKAVAQQLPSWTTCTATDPDQIAIYTDASDTGNGGCVVDGNGNILRHWSGKTVIHNSDAAHKELSAMLLFLRHNAPFLGEYSRSVWKIYCDNLPAICYLNRSAVPTDSAKANLVSKILAMLSAFNVEYVFSHVAGVSNIIADKLSRSW
eukprot:Lankesteria_metandrocarpae@DN803_c0_g1_i1.p1